MNRYIFLHRLTGPAILLLLGVVALLSQAHVVHFGIFVPLVLILIGVLKLAERAVLAGCQYPAPGMGPGMGQQGPPATPYGATGSSTSIVPTHDYSNGNDAEGGQR